MAENAKTEATQKSFLGYLGIWLENLPDLIDVFKFFATIFTFCFAMISTNNGSLAAFVASLFPYYNSLIKTIRLGLLNFRQRSFQRAELIELMQQRWIDSNLRFIRQKNKHFDIFFEINPKGSIPQAIDLRHLNHEKLEKVFKASNESLIILGAKGSGKTQACLELMEILLTEAKADKRRAIPVLIDLSRWQIRQTEKDTPEIFANWLQDYLEEEYQIPPRFAKDCIESFKLILLLDNLDALDLQERRQCLEAINNFILTQLQVPEMIVVCNETAYKELGATQPKLRASIRLKALDAERIKKIFAKVDNLSPPNPAEALWLNPFWLKLSIDAFQDEGILPNHTKSPKEQIQYYLHSQYRASEKTPFSAKQLHRYLGWLAFQLQRKKLSAFSLGELDPSWLETKEVAKKSWWPPLENRAQKLYALLSWLLFTIPCVFLHLILGQGGIDFSTLLFVGLLNQHKAFVASLPIMLPLMLYTSGFQYSFVWLCLAVAVLSFRRLSMPSWRALFIASYFGALFGISQINLPSFTLNTGERIFGITVPFLLGGGLILLQKSQNKGRIKWLPSVLGFVASFVLGLLLDGSATPNLWRILPTSLAAALGLEIILRLMQRPLRMIGQTRMLLHPNQEIWDKFNTAWWIGFSFTLCTTALWAISPEDSFNPDPALIILAPLLGLFIGFFIGSWALDFTNHFIIRWILWLTGDMPLPQSYIPFLNFAHDLGLLQRLGTRYQFLNPEIQEYFANYYQEQRKLRG